MTIVVTTTPRYRMYASRVRAILRLLESFAPENSSIEVHLVGDAVMKKNVLSYEAPETFPHPESKTIPLGEIFLNPAYIRSRDEDFDLMLVHGLLHLLGYDHKQKSDRIKMEKKEDELLALIKKG